MGPQPRPSSPAAPTKRPWFRWPQPMATPCTAVPPNVSVSSASMPLVYDPSPYDTSYWHLPESPHPEPGSIRQMTEPHDTPEKDDDVAGSKSGSACA
uniref:Uncharacterized protein n=1 Tax=Arundo donax TaxID=35708 RepID=A0A0A9C2Y4_ARUDO